MRKDKNNIFIYISKYNIKRKLSFLKDLATPLLQATNYTHYYYYYYFQKTLQHHYSKPPSTPIIIITSKRPGNTITTSHQLHPLLLL